VGSVRTDFREYRPGVAPADWSSQFQAVEATIRSPPVGLADRHYLSVLETAGSSGHAALRWDVVPSSSYFGVLAQLRPRGQGANWDNPLFWLRVGGTLGAEDGLLVYAFTQSGTIDTIGFSARVWDAGSFGPPIAVGTPAVQVPTGVPAVFRCSLSGDPGSGVFRWKAWPVGKEEPAEWDQEVAADEGEQVLPATGGFAVGAQPAAGDTIALDALSLAFE